MNGIVLLILVLHASTTYTAESPLGEGYYIPTVDLLSDKLIGGFKVLKNIPDDCLVCEANEIQDFNYNYFEDTESFFSSITSSFSLGVELQQGFTLGFTFDRTTGHISGQARAVKGTSLNFRARNHQCSVRSVCIYDENAPISKNFLTDFEELPRNVKLPTGRLDFSAYDFFLKKYGSHFITTVVYGSSINQYVFSRAENDYMANDYSVKACTEFNGGTLVQVPNIHVCGNLSEEELKFTKSMETTSRLILRGGTVETRKKLFMERTNENIANFLSASNITKEAIGYSFTAVWTLLGQKYIGTEHFAKVRNLEGYYLGLKNFDCRLIRTKSHILQQFVESETSTSDVPSYKCVIPYQGCHSDQDCHYHLSIWCECSGDTCFKSSTRTQINGKKKEFVTPVYNADWAEQGCTLQINGCKCNNPNTNDWKTIWSQDNDGADGGKRIQGLHYKLSALHKQKLDSKKQEL